MAGANGPVAILLDDLHWADEATLRAPPAARGAGCARSRCCSSIVARDEVPADTHRLRRLRAQLRRVCDPLELPLRPLDREDTARLAAAVAGEELDADDVAALHERTHGIPFYVEELAATLAPRRDAAPRPGRLPLPETVLDAVLLRTEVLSLGGAQRARDRGRRRPALRGRARPEALGRQRRWPRRWPRGFLVEAGPGCSRSATRSCAMPSTTAIPWTRRRSLHAARRARARGGRRVRRPSERRTGSEPATSSAPAAALAEAAAASADVYAYRDAAKLYERALDLGGGTDAERFELLERLAVCAELAGDLAASARAWREVIDGRRGRGEVERVAEAAARASAACSRCAAAPSGR